MSIRPAENSTLDIRHVIGIGTPKAVDLWLDVVTELPDRARELGSLSKAELGKLGPLLDGTNAVELFESIDDKLAAEALHAMDPSLAATFLEALDSDHAANILREFKEPKREALLTLLPLERAMVLRGLLSWPEDCAAAHMVPETLTVRPNMTVSQAVASVRNAPGPAQRCTNHRLRLCDRRRLPPAGCDRLSRPGAGQSRTASP